MSKTIALVALMLVLGSSQVGLCNSGQMSGPAGCLDLVVEIVTAPCQLLATCLGMDGPQCGYPPPRQYKRPCTPVKKSRKNSVEEYSTKVVAPTPEQSERPPVMRPRLPMEPPQPQRASSPPVARDQPSQPPAAQPPAAKEPASPERTARPPALPEPSQPPALSLPRPTAPPAQTAVPSPPSPQRPVEQVRTGVPATETAQKPPAMVAPPAAPASPKAPSETSKTVKKPAPEKGRIKSPCGPVYPVAPCIPAPCWR